MPQCYRKLQHPQERVQEEPGSTKKLPFNPDDFTQVSDTVWEDSDITSYVIEKPFNITKELCVERVEYLNALPSLWPIPRQPTAFIVDLRDPKFSIYDKKGIEHRVDFLVKNKDQDSWTSSTGTSDSRAMVAFQPGYPAISCRRSRSACRGAYACAEVDPKLLRVQRYELDPEPRAKLLIAQRKTQQDEEIGSKEQRAATFLTIVRSGKCSATDSTGKVCNGRPKMQPKPNGASSGHVYFIACSGWRTNFKNGHRTLKIPDYVDEDILAQLMTNQSLSKDCDTAPCSRVVSPHIGLKLKLCPHMHIINGKTGTRSPILHHACKAKRRMYIPESDDPDMRFLLLVHPGPIPHNHPMPPMSKASIDAKATYERCIDAAGSHGLTVQKVDQATSTKLLLEGKTPGEHSTALTNNRIKRDILRRAKAVNHPAGLGLPGVFDLFHKEFTRAKDERYVHEIITTNEGKTLVFTAVPYLLSLIHEVPSFECDTTFKRVKDQGINEWEMVIYYPPVQRALTIARVYVDCADTNHYEQLFTSLQKHIQLLTGSPMRFKKFHKDGNLLCMNADMESAQILGAARSFSRTIDSTISGLPVDITPEELAPYFVRLCLTHTKRGILDFKALVSAQDYQRLMDFPYMESIEELASFSEFVRGLKIKKIQDWWDHKFTSKWIIPCILKSQSKIDREHLDTLPTTTNIGEGQHHWTNHQSGIKLSLLEAILTAREIDERASREVQNTLKTGVKTNSQTNLLHRMARQSQRQIAAWRKSETHMETQGRAAELKAQLEAEKENKRQAAARAKELRNQLKELNACASGRTNTNKSKLSSISDNSSGRVKLSSSSATIQSEVTLSVLQDNNDIGNQAGENQPPNDTTADFEHNSLTNLNDPHFADFDFSQFSMPLFDDLANLFPYFDDASPTQRNFLELENDELPYGVPLPMPPPDSSPPMSSSPIATTSALEYLSFDDIISSSPPPSPTPVQSRASTSKLGVTEINKKGKKRARDEVDEGYILPEGSRRLTSKPSREPQLISLIK